MKPRRPRNPLHDILLPTIGDLPMASPRTLIDPVFCWAGGYDADQ